MLVCQGCQRVLSKHFARIIQSGHLHSITSKTTDIYTVIEEEMTIETVVVPNFLVLLTLEVFFEKID